MRINLFAKCLKKKTNRKINTMGYYIQTTDTNLFLDKKHFDEVYKKMCELNDFHELKRGGSFGANNDNVEGDRYPRDKWFSWMDYNYPETCEDMNSILVMLGFDVSYDKDGNLVDLSYYNKNGAEDYFLSCFAGFVNDESSISWKGEESEDYYRYFFKDGKMIYQRGEMTLDYTNYEEVYNFGELSRSDKAAAEWMEKFKAEKQKIELESI